MGGPGGFTHTRNTHLERGTDHVQNVPRDRGVATGGFPLVQGPLREQCLASHHLQPYIRSGRYKGENMQG